jgi:hypothetical protein
MDMTFEELGKMSKWSVKQLVKSKTHKAAFSYLLKEKNKQTKIFHIQYSDLRMQEYLLEGNKNTEMSKLIYKARGMCLDLKTHKTWKYKDKICVSCEQHSETGDLFIYCSGYGEGKYDKEIKNMQYNIFFDGSSSEMHILAKVIPRRLKIREEIT